MPDQDSSSSAPPPFRRTRTALVLEDDKTLCFLASKYLRKAGWSVILAGSVGEASRHLPNDIEIAVIDINLPDGNGLKFLERMKKAAPRVKPIVLSASANPETRCAAEAAGAYAFLAKPMNPSALISTARKALGAPWTAE